MASNNVGPAVRPALIDDAIDVHRKEFAEKEAKYATASAKADPYLTQLPNPGHRYINERRRQLVNDNRFADADVPEHPKITEALKKRALTPEKFAWYRGMKQNVRIPRAGIPKKDTKDPRSKATGPSDLEVL